MSLEPSPEPVDPAESYEATLELVGAAQKGDRSALEALFERYLPRVRQIVALRMGRRLNQVVEFDDIAQDVLLKVFQQGAANTGKGKINFVLIYFHYQQIS